MRLLAVFILAISAVTAAPSAVDTKPLNVAVVAFDQVENLDLVGPIDVLTRGNAESNKFNLYTVGLTALINTEGKGLKLFRSFDFKNSPDPDIVIVPGARPDYLEAWVKEAKTQPLIDWIKRMATQKDKKRTIMSVCSGAYLLAKAGLLDNTKCTTHFGAIDGLLRLAPTAQVQRNVRYVESGDIITTAGITSGIDGALRLLEKFSSPADAATVAKVMEYKFKAGGAVEGLPSSE